MVYSAAAQSVNQFHHSRNSFVLPDGSASKD
jgi:hypothetical protein